MITYVDGHSAFEDQEFIQKDLPWFQGGLSKVGFLVFLSVLDLGFNPMKTPREGGGLSSQNKKGPCTLCRSPFFDESLLRNSFIIIYILSDECIQNFFTFHELSYNLFACKDFNWLMATIGIISQHFFP